jgi:hypothetical protein
MNNSINKLIEEKINDPFLLLEEHYFTAVLLHNKIYKVQFEDCRMKFSSSFLNHKVGLIGFVYNKVYHIKFILKVFALQKYILKVT